MNVRKTLDWDEFDRAISGDEESICKKEDNTSDVSFKCSKCGALIRRTEEGLFACPAPNCGLLDQCHLDYSPEWSYFNVEGAGSDPTRCGMPINPLLQESSYGGKVLTGGRSSYEMRKISRYTEWLGMPYKEKSHYDEFQRIQQLGSQGGLPKIILEDAKRFHKKISSFRTFRGLNREGIMAASVYISARVNNYPRTPKEIADIFKLDQASATRGCKNAVAIINSLESHLSLDMKTVLYQMSATSFIDRYCSKLGLDSTHSKLCKFVACRVEQNHLIPENTPNSISAGIVYFVGRCCMLHITKTQVSDASGISEVTINKCFKKLLTLREQLIPAVLDKRQPLVD